MYFVCSEKVSVMYSVLENSSLAPVIGAYMSSLCEPHSHRRTCHHSPTASQHPQRHDQRNKGYPVDRALGRQSVDERIIIHL